jgi:hypothetical protein
MLNGCETGVKQTLDAVAGKGPVMCYKMTALEFRL